MMAWLRELDANNFHVLSAVTGLAAAVVGTFVMRWLRGDGETERVTRATLKLDLIAKAKASGLSEAQLKEIDPYFEKELVLRENQDRLALESYAYGIDAIDSAECQQDMNFAQARRLEMLNAKLSAVLHEFDNYLEKDEKKILANAQRLWEKFRDSESAWQARTWKGGTMEPFIYGGAASRITVERLAALEAELNDLRTHS